MATKPAASQTLMTNVQKARARMLLSQPFFANLLLSTDIAYSTALPARMWTDGRKIFINPNRMDDASIDTLHTIFGHELSHIMLLHVPRMIFSNYNRKRWNRATDYAINWMLVKLGFKPLADGNWLFDAKYDGMSADHIYQLLEQEDEGGGGSGGGQPGGGAGDIENTDTGYDLQEPDCAGDPAEMAKLQRNVQQRVAAAANIARLAGKFPADLERMVQNVLEPAIPWTRYLWDYMTKVAHDQENWNRRNRRFRVFLPTRYSEKLGDVIYIGDVSGSIDDEAAMQVISEMRAICETLKPDALRAVWADTRVIREDVFEMGDPVEVKVPGGGGTDMRVPLQHVEQYDPVIVILHTDGYTPWPDEEPPYPLIVVCTTDAPVPIGQVIRI